MDHFVLPDEEAVLSAKQVVEIIQESHGSNRRRASRAVQRGTVASYIESRSHNLLADPYVPFAWQTTTRNSIPYVDATVGNYTYSLYRDGRVSSRPSVPNYRKYPPIASYLLDERWPFSSSGDVSISSTKSESVDNVDVAYAVTGVADYTFDVQVETIRSDESLSLLFAGKGDFDVTASLKEDGNLADEQINTVNTSGDWQVVQTNLDPNHRFGYHHGNLELEVSFTNADAGSKWTYPSFIKQRDDMYVFARALPDGRIILRVFPGGGFSIDGSPVSISQTDIISDGAPDRVSVFCEFLPRHALDRPVVTGRDVSKSHKVEWSYESHLCARPTIPTHDHLPVAEVVPTRTS
jgi:hypothetical protein